MKTLTEVLRTSDKQHGCLSNDNIYDDIKSNNYM